MSIGHSYRRTVCEGECVCVCRSAPTSPSQVGVSGLVTPEELSREPTPELYPTGADDDHAPHGTQHGHVHAHLALPDHHHLNVRLSSEFIRDLSSSGLASVEVF